MFRVIYMHEILWKEIERFDGKYSISSCGKLKNSRTGKLLRFMLHPHGYLHCSIKPNGRDGKSYCLKIHREVAKAFIPNPDNKPQVNHIDGNKQNNSVSNLEWVTSQENMIHAHKNNLIDVNHGIDCVGSKATEDDVREIRKLQASSKFWTNRKLAEKFNLGKTTIHSIISGTSWKHLT